MIESRLERLAKELKQKDFESIWITSKANVYYFSNYYTDPHERIVGIFFDSKDVPVLLLPEMEKEDAVQAGFKGEFVTYNDEMDPILTLFTYLQQNNRVPHNLAIEKDHVTVNRLELLEKYFPNTEVKDGSDILQNLRVIKDKKEYTLLKQAATLADLGVQKGIEAISEGITEMEIVAHLEYALKKEGVKEMSFSTTVLAGEKTASPHGIPGNRKIQKGDLVLFDLGVVFEGYCSDITRTVAYHSITDQQKEIYETVLRAELEAIEAAQIGTEAKKVDDAARTIIANQGYGKYFTHRIGHGLGIDIHEFPSMNGSNTLKLQEGMCFTIEPGIYIPQVGGVRIEDDIFMTAKGPEVLTAYPKELQILT